MNLGKMLKAVLNVDLIVTPIIEPWLLKHGDEALPDDVLAVLLAVMGTKPRNRSGSFSGASAGRCLRSQELGFAGVEQEATDPQLQNIYNDGKYRHLRWQGYLLAAGLVTDIEYLVRWSTKYSRGSVDARGEVSQSHPRKDWRGKEFGLEIKGVSTFQFGKFKTDGPKIDHLRQVHHYFILGGFDLFIIIYEDKTTQSFVEWVITPDPKLLKEAQCDIDNLAKSVDTKTMHPRLPECVKHQGAYAECGYGKNGQCEKALLSPPAPFTKGG